MASAKVVQSAYDMARLREQPGGINPARYSKT